MKEPPKGLNSWKWFWAFLALYAACLLSLISKLSLWLDELIDLRQIRDFDLAPLIAYIPVNAGGVPLNYLIRAAAIHLLGYSLFSGRFPSLLFSLLACVGVFLLGRQLKLRYPLLAVLIFALIPVQLRYALESRPYSQALALSVWATVVFLSMAGKPGLVKAAAYGLIVLAGLYTQPYTVFVPLTHVVWLCWPVAATDRRRLLLFTCLPIGLAALGFVPWYLWAVHMWRGSAAAQLRYTIGIRAVPMIWRELVGTGYAGTLFVLALVAVGCWAGLQSARQRALWAIYILLPIVLAVASDEVFGYFVAVRQMIFVLTPLSLMAALGIEAMLRWNRRLAVAACSLFLAALVVGNIRFFRKPRENWDTAAKTLLVLARHGSCLLFAPSGSIDYYRFFVPQLPDYKCPADLSPTRSVAVAISPYGPPREWDALRPRLAKSGLSKRMEFNRQGPRIELYESAAAR